MLVVFIHGSVSFSQRPGPVQARWGLGLRMLSSSQHGSQTDLGQGLTWGSQPDMLAVGSYPELVTRALACLNHYFWRVNLRTIWMVTGARPKAEISQEFESECLLLMAGRFRDVFCSLNYINSSCARTIRKWVGKLRFTEKTRCFLGSVVTWVAFGFFWGTFRIQSQVSHQFVIELGITSGFLSIVLNAYYIWVFV